MSWLTEYSSTSIGKKQIVAVTGILLIGFLIVHLAGNLKIYQGPEVYDAYSRFLREVGSPVFAHGELLWIARAALLAAVGIHIQAAVALTLASRRARPVGYRRAADLSFSYASRTMRWGGVILAAFVVYHVLHLTFGVAHPDFRRSVYHNVVTAFRAWPVALSYVLAMAPLCLHVYHGLWSTTQTLGLENPRGRAWRRPVAAAVALGLFAGNVSIPVAVWMGWVR